MAKQKSSRGSGSNLDAAENRLNQNDADNYIKEILAILRDILTGSLPLNEVPGFVAWLVKGGAA
jgi:hypothetical protein